MGNISRDIFEDITLYWLTGTGVSAARWYWDSLGRCAQPVRSVLRRQKIWGGPRTWPDKAHPTLSSVHEVDRGGHFPAWNEPQLMAIEGRAAFRPPR
jgi:hypothetical protein